MMRIALVGYGYWGTTVARCLAAHPRVRLTTICDSARSRAAAAADRYPGMRVTTELQGVLADRAIDAVFVATPAASHRDTAVRSLQHGKHVLVEKPLANTREDAEVLVASSVGTGLTLMVNHIYLFSPALAAIRGVIASRRLGPLRYYQGLRANGFGPPDEPSVLADLFVHDVCLLDALVADSPVRVQAVGLDRGRGGRLLHAQVALSYVGGAMASVLVSWCAPAKARTIVLGFERHTIVWDDLVIDGRLRLFDRGIEALPDLDGRRESNVGAEEVSVASNEPLANAIDHFVDCIRGEAVPAADAAAGVRVVRLVDAATESSRTGRSVHLDVTPGVGA